MGYIAVPDVPTQSDLAEEAYAYLQEQVPGWLPADGNLEAWLIQALAQLASELQVLASLVPESIFMYFGETILNLPPYAAQTAYARTTWNVVDGAGYTITAGTLVSITPPASSVAYTFQVASDVVIAPGDTHASGVLINAIEPGSAQSAITGDVAMLDPLDFVVNVYLEGPTTGGSDGETADAYLSRLSDLLTLLTPRPILPQDFAILVEHMIPDVARATAIDLYNASTGATNVPRCVTVAVAGPDGMPCTPQTKADALALLQSEREVNFLCFIIDGTYSQIDVAFTATSYPGWDTAAVAADAIANVKAYLSPATWGLPTVGDPGNPRSWINSNVVRMLEIATVINNTDGINYITALQLGVHGGALGTADITMPGPAALPEAGTITGTVTPTP